MSLFNLSGQQKRVLTFTGLVVALLALMIIAFTVLNSKTSGPGNLVRGEANAKDLSLQQQRLLQSQEVLNKKLVQLQLQDGRYAQLAALKVKPKQLDSIHNQVMAAELALQQTIDSLEQEKGEYRDNKIAAMFNNTRSAFRSVLISRHAASSMRLSVLTDSSMFSDKDLALLEMQNKLIEKESRIVDLEAELKIQPPVPAGEQVVATTPVTTDNKVAGRMNNVDLETINNNLKTINSTLRRENEQLKTQLNQSISTGDVADAGGNTFKAGYASLERKSEDLKADLSFAIVDCNLTRVDASHIISNSRQRKDLLEEALKILNDLSGSADPAIQRRAKEKTAQLNKLANTVRD